MGQYKGMKKRSYLFLKWHVSLACDYSMSPRVIMFSFYMFSLNYHMCINCVYLEHDTWHVRFNSKHHKWLGLKTENSKFWKLWLIMVNGSSCKTWAVMNWYETPWQNGHDEKFALLTSRSFIRSQKKCPSAAEVRQRIAPACMSITPLLYTAHWLS